MEEAFKRMEGATKSEVGICQDHGVDDCVCVRVCVRAFHRTK